MDPANVYGRPRSGGTGATRRPAPILFAHVGEDWIRGSERCLLDLVQYIDRERFTPVVLCNAPSLAEAARALGAVVHVSTGWEETEDQLLPSRQRVAEMHRLVSAHDVRLIHANNPAVIKALLPVARARRLPIVAHLHLIHPRETRLYCALHQVALVVGVSETSLLGMREDGTPPSRLRVIYNGVDARRVLRGDASGLRAALGVAPEDIVLTAVGSLIHRKGIDVLVETMALLRRAGRRYHLLLVGDGAERSTLEARVRDAQLSECVHFLGERQDAGAVLRDASDIAVSAAREEAFPLNVLEAALCGLPIVASDIGPHREAIVEGQTGVLARSEDPRAFAAAIEALADDAERRRELGSRGRARIEQGFLVEHYVQGFERAYAELLSSPPTRYGWLRGTSWPPAYTGWVRRALGRRLRR